MPTLYTYVGSWATSPRERQEGKHGWNVLWSPWSTLVCQEDRTNSRYYLTVRTSCGFFSSSSSFTQHYLSPTCTSARKGEKRNIYSVPHGHLKKPKLHAPASHVIYICALHAGAQWTGIVTTIAVEMLKANMVDAVVCVQRHPNKNQMPHPSFSLQCTSIITWV